MNTIQKYFNEWSHARDLWELKECMTGTINEYTILAKYLWIENAKAENRSLEGYTVEEKEEMGKKIEAQIKEFLDKNYKSIQDTYLQDFLMIEKAIGYAKKYYLYTPDPVPITINEWHKIRELEDENAQKLAFFYLVDAKYSASHKRSIGRSEYSEEYFCRDKITKDPISRMMEIPIGSRKNKTYYMAFRNAYWTLKNAGMIELKTVYRGDRGHNYVNVISYVDDSDDAKIVEYITDYEHILYHYERLCGKPIGTCAGCGRLFRQSETRNKFKYCPDCREKRSQPKERKIKRCEDCGRTIVVLPRTKQDKICRCTDCQKVRNRELARIRKQRQREKENNVTISE